MKAFSIAVLLTILIGLSVPGEAQARTIGIYLCEDCALHSPFPDKNTGNEILLHQGNWNNMNPGDRMEEGDVIILCNGTICVPYTRNADGTYTGGTPVPQLPPSGPGSGGGGGGGGSGTPPGALGGRLVCGYVNGVLSSCQYVYEYVA